MIRPEYCTNHQAPSCWECSLTNYGLDCMNHSISAREMGASGGRIGGRSTSPAKRAASAANGRLGGRPRKQK